MPIEYPGILDKGLPDERLSYSERDAILYALAIGYGADAGDLGFVYEKDLRVVPTFATVLAWHAGLSIKELGLDYPLVVHGAEELIVHRPLAMSGALLADTSIASVHDKGRDKGAVVVRQAVLKDPHDGQPIATVRKTLFARGDGGFGGPAVAAPALQGPPDRPADLVMELTTRRDQAALYRLCGDRNPLHIDPVAARAAGFEGPILHGLCTYGMTCRAVMRAYCNNDPASIASHGMRFAAPVYPGDTLRIDLWSDQTTIFFEASVPARGVKVVKNGRTKLHERAN